jgi:hypothetical protein
MVVINFSQRLTDAMKPLAHIQFNLVALLMMVLSSLSVTAASTDWDFINAQKWSGDEVEGSIEYCQNSSLRWLTPFLDFDVNLDNVDDFLVAISCYQGENPRGEKHNLEMRGAWKMLCSDNGGHYDCTKDLFGTTVIETTAYDGNAAWYGGGNPYIHVHEKPRDLNGDGYPEFWYALNKDDGRPEFLGSVEEDADLLLDLCEPAHPDRYQRDCTRHSKQSMLMSNPDGTYDVIFLPWEPFLAHGMLVLPNLIGTFDLFAMAYGPFKQARWKDGEFVDVTAEFELDPNWHDVSFGGAPYGKVFNHEDTVYIVRADTPNRYRPDWINDVNHSGFTLWKYTPEEGFVFSDVYIPDEADAFRFKMQRGDQIDTVFGATLRGRPTYDPHWHFFHFEVLDDTNEPVLIVRQEGFTTVGDAYRAPYDSSLIYKLASSEELESGGVLTNNLLWPDSTVQGFFVRNGKLIERELPVTSGDALSGNYHKLKDINQDGFLDLIGEVYNELPAVWLNNGQGTLDQLFLGDVFPDFMNDASYWDKTDHKIWGWGAMLYPFYSPNKLDFLYWIKGFTFPPDALNTDGFVYSPGQIAIATAKNPLNLDKKFSPKERHLLHEVCLNKGLTRKPGFQLSCIMGTPFPYDENRDTDEDGYFDHLDAFRFDNSEWLDTDDDGIGNTADLDDDGDGVLDTQEITDGTNPLLTDTDSDGVDDSSDPFPTDILYSMDSDNDGMPDAWETSFGLNPNDPSDAVSDQDNDGMTALNEFLAGTIPLGSLDIDGNENYDALTDGLLLLRSMFGLSGEALIKGTVSSDAIYTNSQDITQRIATLDDLADIDGNGNVDALTDGLLTLRYLFGLEGNALIKDVIADDATRVTAEDIETHLETLAPDI